MNSAAYDIAQFLHQRVGTFGQTLHVGTMPETPDDVVTLYDTGGEAPDTDEMDVFRPTVQIRVRSTSYQSAYEKHDIIRQLLHDATSPALMIASSRFCLITPSADIVSDGKDENDRYLLRLDYRCIRSAL